MPVPFLFIPGEAKGAYRNGSRVVKVRDHPDDQHQPGAEATVLSSLEVPFQDEEKYAYFVEWDDMPGVPCGIAGSAIKAKEE